MARSQFPPRTSAVDRRHFLSQATGALGSVALASLLAGDRWCRARRAGRSDSADDFAAGAAAGRGRLTLPPRPSGC